jgi:hypothetical protein
MRFDKKKIAKALGAERRGKIVTAGGHFGAQQVAAEIVARPGASSNGRRPAIADGPKARGKPHHSK